MDKHKKIHIKLSAEYECYPIWMKDPDNLGDANPRSLPITKELADAIMRWSDNYQKTYRRDDPAESRFNTEEEEIEFYFEGKRLSDKLRDQLGDNFLVEYSCK